MIEEDLNVRINYGESFLHRNCNVDVNEANVQDTAEMKTKTYKKEKRSCRNSWTTQKEMKGAESLNNNLLINKKTERNDTIKSCSKISNSSKNMYFQGKKKTKKKENEG